MIRGKLGQLSLTLRLMMFAGTAITLSLIFSGFLVLKSVKHHFAEQDYEELTVVLESIKHQLNSIDLIEQKFRTLYQKRSQVIMVFFSVLILKMENQYFFPETLSFLSILNMNKN